MLGQKISEGQVPSQYFLSMFIHRPKADKRVTGSQFQTHPAI